MNQYDPQTNVLQGRKDHDREAKTSSRYQPPKSAPSLSEEEAREFWSKVEIGGLDQCWEWRGNRTKKQRYGTFKYRRKNVMAHRIALCQIRPDLGRLCALHHCDNPPCCNPIHLFAGTHLDNIRDMVSKGRHVIPTGLKGDQHPFRKHPECVPRGAAHHKAKLSENEVREIREAWDSGKHQQQELASAYGVSRAAIGWIVYRKNWKHVA